MISIVVPVYNAAAYINDTIKTVQDQTYPDWELILVDDCSKDNSVELIEKYIMDHPEFADRIRLISQDVNGGAAKARNRGIDEAKGRYIAFLDADDIWRADKLERELQFMQKYEAGFVYTAYEFGDENAKPNGRMVRVPKCMTYKEALSRTIIFTSTVLLDTEIVSKNLIHMPSMGSEDTATWWKILKTGITAYGLDQPLVIYRRPAKSLSSNKGKAIKRIWNLYRKVAELSPLVSVFYMIQWACRATFRRFIADTVRAHAETIKRFTAVQLSMMGVLLHTGIFGYAWFGSLYPLLSEPRFSLQGDYLGAGLKLYYRGHILILIVYFAILLFISQSSGALKTGHHKPGSIFGSEVIALVIADVLTYFQISLMRNWLMPVRTWILILLAQVAVTAMWSFMADLIYRHVFPPRETLVIDFGNTDDDPEGADAIVSRLNTRKDRFSVAKIMKYDGDIQRIEKECLRWYGCVVISGGDHGLRKVLCEFCYSHYIRVFLLPEIGDMLLQGTEYLDLFDVPILELKEYSAKWEERIFKRCIDVVVGLLGLIICSWHMFYRIICGDRIIKEKCMARGGKVFNRYRYEVSDSIVPSLINLLNGTMSFIGTSSIPYAEAIKDIEKDSRYLYRYRMKPGLIGYASLYGNKDTDSLSALKMDLYYVQHFSLLNDFRMMLQSIKIK